MSPGRDFGEPYTSRCWRGQPSKLRDEEVRHARMPSRKLRSDTNPLPNELPNEVDRVVEALREGPRAWSLAGLPPVPGLYALAAHGPSVFIELGLVGAEYPDPVGHPLFVGRAAESIAVRVRNGPYRNRATVHSSVRRSLAALLRLSSVLDPWRESPMAEPGMGTHFALTASDEFFLTRWMEARIDVLYAPSDWKPLRQLELAVARELQPILDQEDPPVWNGNPWRSYVTSRRRDMLETGG